MSPKRRKLLAISLIASLGFLIGAFVPRPGANLEILPILNFNSAPASNNFTTIIPDDIRMMWAPENRVEFHLSSPTNSAVLVWTTGVEILTSSGWKIQNEQQRNEPIHLKAGIPRELCVERPRDFTGPWRAFMTYSTEMHGAHLFAANLQEAWYRRSFTNWNGKAWGGGKFSEEAGNYRKAKNKPCHFGKQK